jgi:hypothetical protein
MRWFQRTASAESAAKAIGKDEPHPFSACKEWVSKNDVEVDDVDAFCGKVKSIIGPGKKKKKKKKKKKSD